MSDEPKAPSEAKTVPYDRFKEVNDDKKASLAREARLQQEVDTLKVQNKGGQEAPPQTREELQQLVTDGKMTQQAAQDIIDQQFFDKTQKAAADAAVAAVQQNSQEERMKAKFAAYEKAHPEAWQAGSDKANQVKTRYNELVADGLPANEATELTALKMEFGSPQSPRAIKPETQFQHGGGDSGVYSQDDIPRGDGIPAGLAEKMTPRQTTWYKNLVALGDYDWDKVEKELEYNNPERAKKYDMMFGKPKRRR